MGNSSKSLSNASLAHTSQPVLCLWPLPLLWLICKSLLSCLRAIWLWGYRGLWIFGWLQRIFQILFWVCMCKRQRWSLIMPWHLSQNMCGGWRISGIYSQLPTCWSRVFPVVSINVQLIPGHLAMKLLDNSLVSPSSLTVGILGSQIYTTHIAFNVGSGDWKSSH